MTSNVECLENLVKAVGHKLDVIELMDKNITSDLNVMSFLEDVNNCQSKLNEIHTLNNLLNEKKKNSKNKLNLRKGQISEKIKQLNSS